jgi:hypothetical protein
MSGMTTEGDPIVEEEGLVVEDNQLLLTQYVDWAMWQFQKSLF